MPIYEYICSECEERFEQFIWSSADAGEVRCPSCGAGGPRKVMSTFGVGRSLGATASCPSAATCGTGG